MNYFDQQQLLALNPVYPYTIDGDIARSLYRCKCVMSIVQCLRDNQILLNEDITKFESILDAHWYHGEAYNQYIDKVFAHLILKQIVQFIQLHSPNIENICSEITDFYQKNKSDYKDNSLQALYNYQHENQALVSYQISVDILQERIDTLAEKLNILALQQEYDDYLESFLQSCISLLINECGDKGCNFVKSLCDSNNPLVTMAVFDGLKREDIPKYDILNQIINLNRQRIDKNKNNNHQTTSFLWNHKLNFLAYEGNENQTINNDTNYTLALMAIERLLDIMTKTCSIDTLEGEFLLINFKFSMEQHPVEYQKLHGLLQDIIDNKKYTFDDRFDAILITYKCLGVTLHNHQELLQEMKTVSHSRFFFQRANPFFSTVFTLTDVLYNLDGSFAQTALNYLEDSEEQTPLTNNHIFVSQFHTTILPILQIELDEQDIYNNKVGSINRILLTYSLSIEQILAVTNILQKSRTNAVSHKDIHTDLTRLLVIWQEKIYQISPALVKQHQIIHEDDMHLQPWDKAQVYWQYHDINKDNSFQQLATCSFMKNSDVISWDNECVYNYRSNIIYRQMINVMSHQHNLKFVHELDSPCESSRSFFELYEELLGFIDVIINHAKQTHEYIALNTLQNAKFTTYFEFENTTYQIQSKDMSSDSVIYAVGCLNVFLQHINHEYRFYSIEEDFSSDDTEQYMFITSVHYDKFTEINKRLRLPINLITT